MVRPRAMDLKNAGNAVPRAIMTPVTMAVIWMAWPTTCGL